MAKRTPSKGLLLAIGLVHFTITAVTWHDIQYRPADEIRGSKRLWRLFSAANTTGSLAYLLVGRRRHQA